MVSHTACSQVRPSVMRPHALGRSRIQSRRSGARSASHSLARLGSRPIGLSLPSAFSTKK
eukprot:4128878-Lingulodinium_polyedra.AAC.1